MPEPRRGWPLDYIPGGEANWRAFVAQATPDQVEQVCLCFARDALLAGNTPLALDALNAVLADRARRGVGGVLQ
jgi:hypothetical protein